MWECHLAQIQSIILFFGSQELIFQLDSPNWVTQLIEIDSSSVHLLKSYLLDSDLVVVESGGLTVVRRDSSWNDVTDVIFHFYAKQGRFVRIWLFSLFFQHLLDRDGRLAVRIKIAALIERGKDRL